MPDKSPSPIAQIATIGLRDAREAMRDRFLLWAVIFLTVAALVSLVTGSIALHGDAATYAKAKALLLALGKDASALAAPEFYPLKLLRGTIEQIEIQRRCVDDLNLVACLTQVGGDGDGSQRHRVVKRAAAHQPVEHAAVVERRNDDGYFHESPLQLRRSRTAQVSASAGVPQRSR